MTTIILYFSSPSTPPSLSLSPFLPSLYPSISLSFSLSLSLPLLPPPCLTALFHSLALVDDNTLLIGSVDQIQMLHIQTIPLGETPRYILCMCVECSTLFSTLWSRNLFFLQTHCLPRELSLIRCCQLSCWCGLSGRSQDIQTTKTKVCCVAASVCACTMYVPLSLFRQKLTIVSLYSVCMYMYVPIVSACEGGVYYLSIYITL